MVWSQINNKIVIAVNEDKGIVSGIITCFSYYNVVSKTL